MVSIGLLCLAVFYCTALLSSVMLNHKYVCVCVYGSLMGSPCGFGDCLFESKDVEEHFLTLELQQRHMGSISPI